MPSFYVSDTQSKAKVFEIIQLVCFNGQWATGRLVRAVAAVRVPTT
jgi:hypothetical protein